MEEQISNIVDFNERRNKRKKEKRKIYLIIILIIFISLVNIFFGFDRTKKDVSITIEGGSSIFEIADELESERVISKKIKFITSVILSGNKSKLKYGTFNFKKGMSHGDVINIMVNEGAKKETVTLVVPEGFSVENIISRMSQLGFGEPEEIEKSLSDSYDYEFISHISEKRGQKYKLQGFLFPSTYEFYKDADAHTVFDRMLSEFQKQYSKLSGSYEDMYEIITKASMIEREAKIASERKIIAGVFENRLRKSMRLQVDATVQYVVSDGRYDVKRILYKDLEINSPYNTYVVDGLPVGPISNPGLESIKAAMFPQEHEYLFYHTDDAKNDGSHIFTREFEEHKETMSE